MWALWNYNEVDPIILSPDETDEVSIGDVANMIASAMDFQVSKSLSSYMPAWLLCFCCALQIMWTHTPTHIDTIATALGFAQDVIHLHGIVSTHLVCIGAQPLPATG